MKNGRKLMQKWIGFLPSLFDVLICFYLFFIAFWPNKYEIKIAFNLWIMCLLPLTLFFKSLRSYKSLPLILLTTWAFISIFLHSYRPNYSSENIIFKYLNIFVLSEGFIYVFSGVFLLHLIVRYSKSLWLYIVSIAICSIPYFSSAYSHGKMSFTVSLLLAIIAYSVTNRKYVLTKISIGLLSLGTLALYLKWLLTVQVEAKNVIYFKFACRPYVWIQLCRDLKEHWIVGTGFPHYLGIPNMFWVGKIGNVEQGWLFRHNDYLGLGVYLGSIAILLLIWFVIESTVVMRHSYAVIPFLTVAIIPFFSCTMFDVYNASLFIAVAALSLRMGYVQKINV